MPQALVGKTAGGTVAMDGRRTQAAEGVPCAEAGSRGNSAATPRTVWRQSVPRMEASPRRAVAGRMPSDAGKPRQAAGLA